MKITILGKPITKKNSQQIIPGPRPRLIQSKQFRQYEKDFIKQIRPEDKQDICKPVNVRCTYFMPTKRKVDLTNLLAATHDCLVKGGVLEDDNCQIIVSVDGSRVDYDKANPRVEIVIKEY